MCGNPGCQNVYEIQKEIDMCVQIYIQTQLCIQMYIYTYTHIYIYMSLHVAHVGGKMCGQIECRRVYEIPRNVYIDIYISIYGSTCVYMYVYICIYTYTYIYTYIYIYTCIHSPDMWPNVQANAYLIPLEIYIYISILSLQDEKAVSSPRSW